MSSAQSNQLQTLLVVDDDSITRKTLTKTLGKVGYQIEQAANGLEAISSFEEHKPDMIIMDVMMPEMDGYTACRKLREISGPHYPPILLLTGLNDITAVEMAFESGATDFITKPVNWSLLTQRVKYCLRSQGMVLELQKKQAQLYRSQQLAKLGYYEYHPSSSSVYYSDVLAHTLGAKEKESLSEFLARMNKEDAVLIEAYLEETLATGAVFETDHLLSGNSQNFFVHHYGEILQDHYGKPVGVAAIVQDITERRRAEDLIEYQANFDTVTGLPNRTHFERILFEVYRNALQNEQLHGLVAFAVDRTAEHTAALGHHGLDILLQSIADQIRMLESETVRVAYIDSGCFAVLIRDIKCVDSLRENIDTIKALLNRHFTINDYDIFSSVSIGYSLFPLGENGCHEALQNTMAAVHECQRRGGDTSLQFEAKMNNKARHRLSIESEMRRGLERGEFKVYYQPKLSVRGQQIQGMEALVRWMHPQRGLVPPLEFIPLAEETGLIDQIGRYVLYTACVDTVHWQQQGFNLSVAVNVSTKQFNNPRFLSDVNVILDQSHLDAKSLDLEITESLAIQDIEKSLHLLREIRDFGIKTSIDDFGTGQSSLSMLQKLPVDTIKIDKSFVDEITSSPNSGILVKTIIAMAHSLGLKTVAEGVEATYQYEFLAQYQCEELQGYLFSPPLAKENFDLYLSDLNMGKPTLRKAV